MDRRILLDCLRKADFGRLFRECGWSNPTSAEPYAQRMGETDWVFRETAQMKGYRVFVCETTILPDSATCRWLDARLRKRSHDYLAIYVKVSDAAIGGASMAAEPGTASDMHHLWAVPVTGADKRQLVKIEYASDEQSAFLAEKLDAITFGIDEEPSIVDVESRVNATFLVNAAEVTKRFYREFRNQHSLFVRGIEGLANAADRDWYASVMLNRLMFCYFIQKRGFLDQNPNYLGDKLAWVAATRGRNRFQSFYRSFLRCLFEKGLDTPSDARGAEWDATAFGRIPYLNGGMFAKHPLEAAYPDIDIPDEVFGRLFGFFDEWRWHLDTRISASGRDINPDVLGYIFEQYINDRAQMGAYYTKEDITEYIGRNTIVPWLLGEVAGKAAGGMKGMMAKVRTSGDRYIFPAMLKGVDIPLPDDIGCGVPAEPQATLRKRRAAWNAPAGAAWALPTEIWRETVARRQRVTELRRAIREGEVRSPDDFVTLNLDIRAFAEDLVRETDDHRFVGQFYDALRRVSILDPTCGSGAFLFAALDILEPLYDACLDRMEEFHDTNPRLFPDQIDELAAARNRLYFVDKSIILRNLYGVDLMHEATEIARLRLFLKMVAAVDPDPRDPNLGLDPLPDVDFNIRTGNTLVGYANPADVKAAILPPDQLALDTELYDRVEAKAQDVADIFERFKALQQTSAADAGFAQAKTELNKKLAELNKTLDRAMAERDLGIDPGTLRGNQCFSEWKAKAQPFHWFSDFYAITVVNKGFDVIIGNPPYVEYSKVHDYRVRGYATETCGNLYAMVIERSYQLMNARARIGMIIPISCVATERMEAFRQQWISRHLATHASLYSADAHPSILFNGVKFRLAILLQSHGEELFTTHFQRWYPEFRDYLFQSIAYTRLPSNLIRDGLVPKLAFPIQAEIYRKVSATSHTVAENVVLGSGYTIYAHRIVAHYVKAFNFVPYFSSERDGEKKSEDYKPFSLCTSENALALCALLNSTLFYSWFVAYSDVYHCGRELILHFPIDLTSWATSCALQIKLAVEKLMADIQANKIRRTVPYKSTGLVVYDEFYPRQSKPLIDEIDTLLARHYGFTEEELDYIINYDIKYRMGDRLGEGEG